MIRSVAALLCLAVIAAPAGARPRPRPSVPNGEAQLQSLLKGAVAGRTSSCLPLVRTSDSQMIYGVGILYGRGRTTYLMRFQDGCPSLGRNQILVTHSVGRMCRGDIAQVIENSPQAMARGSCVVGDFTTYTRPK